MIQSYFRLALRLLVYNPFYSIINVLGLSVGFAVFFILWPFAQSELKSDQFIPGHESIFRVVVDWRWSDDGGATWGQLRMGSFSSFIGSEVANSLSGVKAVTRTLPQASFATEGDVFGTKIIINRPNRSELFTEERAIRADSNFFSFFDLPLLEGDPKAILSKSQSIAISESRARAIFGSEPALNQMVEVNKIPFAVTGVFQDIPSNSHLQFDVVFSSVGTLQVWNSQQTRTWARIYVKLDGVDPTGLEEHLNKHVKRYGGIHLETYPNLKLEFSTQPLREIAFSHNYILDMFEGNDKFILNLLAGVSILVLVMAWMNYLNLAVSRTSTRFKEMAVRKVSGARTNDVFIQFICQTFLVNALALVMGVTLVQLVRIPFEEFLGIPTKSFWQLDPSVLAFFAIMFIVGTVITACYPAFNVTQIPVKQLAAGKTTTRRMTISTLLTVMQYSVALVLMTWILIVFFELDLILNKDAGLSKDNVIVFDSPIVSNAASTSPDLATLVKELEAEPGVNDVALSRTVPGDPHEHFDFKRYDNSLPKGFAIVPTDESYIPLYKIKLLAGRNFRADDLDSLLILSKVAAERLGFDSPEQAIGARVYSLEGIKWTKVEVVGVVDDYRLTPYYSSSDNTESEIESGLCIYYDRNHKAVKRISVHVEMTDFKKTIASIESDYVSIFPGNPFNWSFVEDHVNRAYAGQRVVRNQVAFFTLLAIAVACLGLLGMISNKVVEKTKEIGVRKILGAGIVNIFSILLGSTAKQVLAAVIIASPCAWFVTVSYLERFTERIELHWWHYAIPVSMLSAIMIGTVVSVLIRALHSSPVDALRHE